MMAPQPPSRSAGRRFRVDRKLDRRQLRHVNALSTGRTLGRSRTDEDGEMRAASARTPGRYEIVSMEESAFVFDSQTSRFADVRADDWREQLTGSPRPPASPPTSAEIRRAQEATSTPRGQRNIHGRLKATQPSATLHDDPLAALGKPDDTFQWPESLGGAAKSHPKRKDEMLDARLKLPAVAAGVDRQRHRRLVREGAPQTGAVVMFTPFSEVERARWARCGGEGWPKLARLKRFRVHPARDGKKAAGKATIELLVDGTMVDEVDMQSLTEEPQARWAMREAAVVAAMALPPRLPGWNPELEAQKQRAAREAGYAEPFGMEKAKDDAAWKAEMAAREWERAVFDMQEEDWERACGEEWEARAAVEREKSMAEAARAAEVRTEEERRLKAAAQAAAAQAELDEQRRLTHNFINWRQPYEDLKRLRIHMNLWKRQVEAARRASELAAKKKLEWKEKEAELTPEQKRARDRIADFKRKEAAARAAELRAEEEEEARRLAALDDFTRRPGAQQATLVKQQQLEDVTSSSDSSTTVGSSDEELAAAAAPAQPEPEPEPEPDLEPEPEPDLELDETQCMGLTPETELVDTVNVEEATSPAKEHEPRSLQISTTESVHEDEDHEVQDEEGKEYKSRSTMDFDAVQVTPLLDSLTAMLPTEDTAEEVAEEISDALSSTDEHQCSLTQPAEITVAEVVPEMVVEHAEEEELHLGPTVHQMMYPLGGPLDTPPSSNEEQSGQEGSSVLAAAELSTGDPQAPSVSEGNELGEVPDELDGVDETVDEGISESATVTRKVRLGM